MRFTAELPSLFKSILLYRKYIK